MTLGRFYGRALGLFRGLWNWWADDEPPVAPPHIIEITATFQDNDLIGTFDEHSLTATYKVHEIIGSFTQ